jgi:hypothetical protein
MAEDTNTWQCPFCGAFSVLTKERIRYNWTVLDIENPEGNRILDCRFIVCASPRCHKAALYVSLHKAELSRGTSPQWVPTQIIDQWRLIAWSLAKTFPSYIPEAILQDYREACAILQLSPKAAATLARRCLQGMIRDFWQVKMPRLVLEINELQSKVEPAVWDAIDAVRQIGNIGAHMEQDVNLIVDVEPQEATALIKLIEMLLQEWYIARHEREQRLAEVKTISVAKKELKKRSP